MELNKTLILKILFCLLLALSLVYFTTATTYYINSSNGNDATGDGSISAPYKTILKSNSLTYAPGSTIIFNGVFRVANDANIIIDSGNSSHNNIYDCSDCIIYGSFNLSNDVWNDEGGNIWSIGGNYSTDGTELVYNPSLSTDTTGWTSYFNSGASASGGITRDTVTYYSSPGSLNITVNNNGGTGSDVQIYTSTSTYAFDFESDTYYKVTFYGMSNQSFTIPQDDDGTNGEVRFLDATSDVTDSYNEIDLNFNSSWQKFTLYFKTTTSGTGGSIRFYLGGVVPDNTKVNIDNVSVQKINATNVIYEDIGILKFNNSYGVKEELPSHLNSQGEFTHNYSLWKFYLYSTSNPTTVYSLIEGGVREQLIYGSSKKYYVVQHFNLSYGGRGAIESYNSNNYIVQNNTLAWGGGSYQTRPASDGTGEVRYGNGIAIEMNSSNITVRYNNISQWYDACISPQSYLSGGASVESNITIQYNLATYCYYPYEFFITYVAGSRGTDFLIDHNTFVVGSEWSNSQRPDSSTASQIRLSRCANCTGYHNFTNNIVYATNDYLILMGSGSTSNWRGEILSDYNNFYNESDWLLEWNATSYSSLVSYQSGEDQDLNSFNGDPDFVSGTFIPNANSPVCGAASDGGDIGALPCVSYGSELYFSNDGDDDYDCSLTTPCASLSLLNNITENNTIIYLNRGDTFIGNINISNKNNITITSYGTGNKPRIIGITNVTNWSIDSGNIYYATLNDTPIDIYVNGNYINQSYYPNDGSYLTASSASSNAYYLNDTDLNLTEAQVEQSNLRTHPRNWVIEDITTITNYNETTHVINWSYASTYTISSGNEYYLYGARWMLNESSWWYNSTSKLLYIWLAGGTNPNNSIIYAPTIDNLTYIINSYNINIYNISFEYAKYNGVSLDDCDDCNISDINVSNVGYRFIYLFEGNNDYVKNIYGEKSRRDGIYVYYCSNTTIDNNTLIHVGDYGIPVRSYAIIKVANNYATDYSNISIINNNISNSGYIGINAESNGIIVDKNIISSYCKVLDDCGGIYLWGYYNKTKTITNNIIKNSASSRLLGSADAAEGIYMDDKSGNSTIINNTIIDTTRGIYLHNSFGNTVLNNTVYNSRNYAFWMKEDSSGYTGFMVKNNISGNIFLTNATSSYPMFIEGQLGSIAFGETDNNVYANPYNGNPSTIIGRKITSTTTYYDLETWQTVSGNDSNSKSLYDYYNITSYSNIVSNKELITNNVFENSYTNWSRYPGDYNTMSIFNCSFSTNCLNITHNDTSAITTQILISNTFPIVSGQVYRIRFNISTNNTGSVNVILRRNGPTYESLGFSTNYLITPSVLNIDTVFVATATQTGRLDFEFGNNNTALYIDNVYVTNVTSYTANDKSDDFNFLYTETVSDTFPLSTSYQDVYGQTYSNSVSLGAYKSLLLYPTQLFNSCMGLRGIVCDRIGCFYNLERCSEDNIIRTSFITCTTGGCS